MFADLLRDRLGSLVELSTIQISQLESHFDLLIRWNKVLNLTSVRVPEQIVDRHYCESIFLGLQLPAGELRVADIGSGAGFPGIPIAVARPDCMTTLIESHQRKAVFLREASRELSNVGVLSVRAETVSDKFDWVVSRAVDFREIEESAASLAGNVALLAGQQQPSDLRFTWNTPLLDPWGKQRYLWIGSRRST